jgi:hypothetical protein
MDIIKETAYNDFTVKLSKAVNGKLNYEITFSGSAIQRNNELLQVIGRRIIPNDNIIADQALNRLTILNLPEGMFFNHFLVQLVKLQDNKTINLDFGHKRPLSHEQSLGDIRSSKISVEMKKEISKLEKVIKSITFAP